MVFRGFFLESKFGLTAGRDREDLSACAADCRRPSVVRAGVRGDPARGGCGLVVEGVCPHHTHGDREAWDSARHWARLLLSGSAHSGRKYRPKTAIL